jgi:hypothetical protein
MWWAVKSPVSRLCRGKPSAGGGGWDVTGVAGLGQVALRVKQECGGSPGHTRLSDGSGGLGTAPSLALLAPARRTAAHPRIRLPPPPALDGAAV